MTKCPICKNVDLHMASYDDQLPVNECSSCGGAWLRANEYLLWLQHQHPGKFDLTNASELSKRLRIIDSHQAAICPDCGHLLRSYQVASNLDFHVDRCNNCNGIWLDKNEWQALKAADLHDEINRIFTQPWQDHIHEEIAAQKLDTMYLERFGASDYQKIKEIRRWLQENPNRSRLIAFLMDKDPYMS